MAKKARAAAEKVKPAAPLTVLGVSAAAAPVSELEPASDLDPDSELEPEPEEPEEPEPEEPDSEASPEPEEPDSELEPEPEPEVGLEEEPVPVAVESSLSLEPLVAEAVAVTKVPVE